MDIVLGDQRRLKKWLADNPDHPQYAGARLGLADYVAEEILLLAEESNG